MSLQARNVLVPCLALLTAGALVACEQESAAPEPSGEGTVPAVVSFTAADYSYEGPSSVPAGVTQLTLNNEGAEPHQIQLVKFSEGKTVADVGAALASEEEGAADWLDLAGGPNGASPGASASSFVDLQEGDYALLCFIPSPDGVPHAAKGMSSGLTVTAATTEVKAPAAAVDIDGTEFAFTVDGDLQSGANTVAFHNKGTQPHEAFFARLDEGATANDFITAFSPDAQGPPPGALVGGVVGIMPGASETFDLPLEPGHYALICAFEDPETGTPHFAVGMQTEFDIK